jgi:hypothetical protein
LLEFYINGLEAAALVQSRRALSFDSRIPESVLLRLMQLYQAPEDAALIDAHDYHIVFANLMFRYPTVRIWESKHGEWWLEL